MARPERVLNPEAGPLQQFAHDLVQLRKNAPGITTLQDLADRSGYSRTALSDACSGQKLPSRDLLEAYVGACGADTQAWLARWEQLTDAASAPARPAAEPAEDDQPASTASPAQPATEAEATKPSSPRPPWRHSVAVPILISALIIAAVLLARPQGGGSTPHAALPPEATTGPTATETGPPNDPIGSSPQPTPPGTSQTTSSGQTVTADPVGEATEPPASTAPSTTVHSTAPPASTTSSTSVHSTAPSSVNAPSTTAPNPNPPTPPPTALLRTLGPGSGSCGVEMANDSGNSYWNWHPVEGYSGACVPYYTRQSGINASKAGSWKADAQWEFTDLAPAGASITCTVSAYIPNTPRADAEALYTVYDRPGENSQDLLDYQWITQNQHHGSWVQITGQSTFTFTTTTGYLDLVIANPNNTTSGDQKTIVADAAKVNCG